MTTGRSDIREGYAVFTQDGEQLGTVKEVRGQYFKVNAPMQRDYWLSSDAVTSTSGDRVTLSIDSGRVDEYKAADPADYEAAGAGGTQSGATSETTTSTAAGTAGATTAAGGSHQGAYTTTAWDQAGPTYRQRWQERYGSSGGRWEDHEPAYRYGHEMRGESRFQGRRWEDAESDLRTDYADWSRRQGYQHDEGAWDRMKNSVRDAWDRGERDTDRIQLREEELRARKQPVEAGEVQVRKEVHEEERTLDVPVKREEVYVERQPVDRRPADTPIGQDQESIRVPVREERVEVEKQPVVREELSMGKRTVEDTERVSDTVHREEARVEREGDVEMRGEGEPRRGT